MAPVFLPRPGYTHDSDEVDIDNEYQHAEFNPGEITLTQMAFYYAVFFFSLVAVWAVVFCFLKLLGLRQKTRNPQQRRMYAGTRVRSPSLSQVPPTIYVSPSNLPPPPKYEAMAPPSYEEVVGIHYPNYQTTIAVQPITQPIIAATQSATRTPAADDATNQPASCTTVVTVTNTSEPRRTSTVTVANR